MPDLPQLGPHPSSAEARGGRAARPRPCAPWQRPAVVTGFPVDGPVTVAGGFAHRLVLPGGRAVQAVHVGPFDTLEQTYEALLAWLSEQGLTPSGQMWESYLSDPAVEPDPAAWRTLIVWPVT